MLDTSRTTSSLTLAKRPLLPALLLLFVGSGCAALIYEVVWLQLLQLIVGSSAISLGVLLGTFMGGMCLGSLLLPKLISTARHPLRVYACLELGIGIIGLLELFGIPIVDRFYCAHVGTGAMAIVMRAVVGAICLLPPTLLMGATLPAIARWVQATPQGVSWLGFFYGGNIAGAVLGCLLAGFYLLPQHDMETATYVAAAINASVAIIAWLLSTRAEHQPLDRPDSAELDRAQSGAWLVYLAIALSGASALGAEVVWTRLLSLLLGGTVYTFSLILAVFLVGLGIGSSVGAAIARSVKRPKIALGFCQFALALGIFWSAAMICRSLPYWPVSPDLASNADAGKTVSSSLPWTYLQLDLARVAWAVLPPTLFWGGSFPLALAAVAARNRDTGGMVGRVYAANTIGAIVGALLFSMVLIGWRGTQFSQQTLVCIPAAAALLMLITGWYNASAPRLVLCGVTTVIIGLSALMMAHHVARAPDQMFLWGRFSAIGMQGATPLYIGEGRVSTVAVSEQAGARNFHVAGKVEASSLDRDMRLQRMLGHIPALFHPNPQSVLVVGCGAGVTAGCFVLHPEVKRIVICEIEPLIPENVANKYFSEENYGVVHDPRVEIVYDDARHYILTTKEKFDVITSDPIHPWVKGAATLYTKEYYELCKARLNPGGIYGQWVPLYESRLDVVKSEIATFMNVFPDGTIWSNDENGAGYDTIVLGKAEPMRIDVDQLQERIERPDHHRLLMSLMHVKFGSAIDLCETYAGQGKDLQPWMKDAQLNLDRNLRLQYLAGVALNSNQSDVIFNQIVEYRRFPDEIFGGSSDRISMLRKTISPRKGPI
jgi:spermidine synthase